MRQYLQKDKWLLLGSVLLGGITAALSAFISILLQKIMDAAISSDLNSFWNLFWYTLIYLAVLGAMGFLESYCGKRLLRNVSLHLRHRIFHGVMEKSPVDFYGHNTADYLSVLVNDVKLVEENYLIPLLLCSQMAVLFLTTLGILFYLSPIVALILLLFLVLMFIIPALFGKVLQKRQDAYSDALAEYTAKVKDYLNGYEIIRSFSIPSYIFRKYTTINQKTADKKFASDKLLALNECLSDLLSSLSVIVVVFVSAYFVLKGSMSMGTLLALIQLSGTFVTPVVLLMQNLPKITGIKPVVEHFNSFSIPDSKKDVVPPNQPTVSLPESGRFLQALCCKELSFSYEDNLNVLEKLNLTIEAGKKYALLGGNGGGKSTLVRLLTGYTPDYRGQITLDDQEIRNLPLNYLNNMISVIHQNIFLFDTDIYENICLGREYTDQELQQALELSGTAQFLPQLEHGLHTPVGENGRLLSGGQRQRIAVARALIRKTPILILDEGTSAVDVQNAFDIEKNLLSIETLTLITITHHQNQELVSYYDSILNLKNGQITELSPAR